MASKKKAKPKPKKKMTPREQSAQFIKTARELDSDESGDAFKKGLGKILGS